MCALNARIFFGCIHDIEDQVTPVGREKLSARPCLSTGMDRDNLDMQFIVLCSMYSSQCSCVESIQPHTVEPP